MANLAARYGAQLNAGNEFLAQLKKINPIPTPVPVPVPAPVRARAPMPVAGYFHPASETYVETSDPQLARYWATQQKPVSWTVHSRGGKRRKTRKIRKTRRTSRK